MENPFEEKFRKHLELGDSPQEDSPADFDSNFNGDIDKQFPIGVASFELFIPDAQSLKEKRFVVKSLKERLKAKFNISVAETEFQNLWQRSMIVVVTVSNEQNHIKKVLSNVSEFIERESRLVVIDRRINIV